jgi:hypothetical protein
MTECDRPKLMCVINLPSAAGFLSDKMTVCRDTAKTATIGMELSSRKPVVTKFSASFWLQSIHRFLTTHPFNVRSLHHYIISFETLQRCGYTQREATTTTKKNQKKVPGQTRKPDRPTDRMVRDEWSIENRKMRSENIMIRKSVRLSVVYFIIILYTAGILK